MSLADTWAHPCHEHVALVMLGSGLSALARSGWDNGTLQQPMAVARPVKLSVTTSQSRSALKSRF